MLALAAALGCGCATTKRPVVVPSPAPATQVVAPASRPEQVTVPVTETVRELPQPYSGSTRVSYDPRDPYYQGRTAVITPLDDYSKHLGPNGGLSVRVTDEQGAVMSGAPVTYSTDVAGSLLTANPYGRGRLHRLDCLTDENGVATAYVHK